MISFLFGALVAIAACLVVNYLFPAVFAKLTRKVGKVVDKV
jgi:hypothetical protein